MERCAKILKTLFFPHGLCFLLLVPLSAVLLIVAFLNRAAAGLLVYGAYLLSAYTLAALCCRAPGLIRFWRAFGQSNPYVMRYRRDIRWRTTLSLYGSLTLNGAYALLQLGLGLYHHTVWYYAMAAYYLMLAVMRYYLLAYTRRFAPGEQPGLEWRHYRFCGIVLLGMNLALSVIVFYITWQNRRFLHHPITTIAMAAYTFTAFTLAILHMARHRARQSPVLSAVRIIGFTAALVSMLTLEATMLTVFGEGANRDFDRRMLGSTGAVVMLIVLILAVRMIGTAAKALRQQRQAAPQQKGD